MRVLIIGINHQIQSATIGWSNDPKAQAFMDDQKRRFATLLRTEMRERGVRFVGEETRHGDTSIAEGVCGEETIRYSNIEMSPEARAQANIPPGYNEDEAVSDADKSRWNRQREEFMLNATIAGAGQVESVLVICGNMHTAPIAAGLRGLGHHAEVLDLQTQDWYVEDWFGHMMHNL